MSVSDCPDALGVILDYDLLPYMQLQDKNPDNACYDYQDAENIPRPARHRLCVKFKG